MKKWDLPGLKPLFVMMAAALATVIMYLSLYYYNNQYTLKAKQPEKGILEITGEELTRHPLHSLISGWEFYPGQLFKPEDFEDRMVGEKPVYVSVGRYRQREGEERMKWTKGTFRLRLSLPDDGTIYAVKIPESTVTGTVYIQDAAALELGKGIGSQSMIIPFEGSGSVQLLIQVSDPGLGGSQLFPPILFGCFQEIRRVHDIQLLFRTVMLVLTAGALGLTLHLAVRIRWWRGYLFSLFCLAFLGYSVWLVVQTEMVMRIQPWFTIRIFSFHVMLWLAVILENDLYRIRGGKVSMILGAFSLLSLIYGCNAQRVPGFVTDIYFYISEWFKYAVAFYLILVADTAVVEQMERSAALLFMGTAFAATLFMEQLLPYYEPITGAAFIVGGCVILFAGMFCILWSDMVDAFRARTVFAYEADRMTRQLSLQREHYQQLNAKIEETRRLRHDMRHHIHLLYTLTESGELRQIREYLEQLLPMMEKKERLAYTANYALDAVLCHYALRAKQEHIELNIRASLPEKTVLPDDELCVVFGNLLENAVEACMRQTGGEAFINLSCGQDETRFFAVVDNSYEGTVDYQDGYYHSSKREGVGISVESVKGIIRKHNGMAAFEPEEGIFKVSIMIPVPAREASDF